MKTHWQTIVRTAIKSACGGIIAKGYTDESGVEMISGAIVLVISIVWGIVEDKLIAKKAQNTP